MSLKTLFPHQGMMPYGNYQQYHVYTGETINAGNFTEFIEGYGLSNAEQETININSAFTTVQMTENEIVVLTRTGYKILQTSTNGSCVIMKEGTYILPYTCTQLFKSVKIDDTTLLLTYLNNTNVVYLFLNYDNVEKIIEIANSSLPFTISGFSNVKKAKMVKNGENVVFSIFGQSTNGFLMRFFIGKITDEIELLSGHDFIPGSPWDDTLINFDQITYDFDVSENYLYYVVSRPRVLNTSMYNLYFSKFDISSGELVPVIENARTNDDSRLYNIGVVKNMNEDYTVIFANSGNNNYLTVCRINYNETTSRITNNVLILTQVSNFSPKEALLYRTDTSNNTYFVFSDTTSVRLVCSTITQNSVTKTPLNCMGQVIYHNNDLQQIFSLICDDINNVIIYRYYQYSSTNPDFYDNKTQALITEIQVKLAYTNLPTGIATTSGEGGILPGENDFITVYTPYVVNN